MIIAILGGGSNMLDSANAQNFEYHPRFGVIRLDDEVRTAIKKFPNLASCLKSNSAKDGKPNLNDIDWDKIENDGDAKVCLFMIFEQLKNSEKVKIWLARQGFKPFGPSQIARLYKDEALLFNLEESLIGQNLIGLTGSWSLQGQYPKFPTSGFRYYYRRVLSRSQTIGVTWFPDGKLMDISVSYDSIFN